MTPVTTIRHCACCLRARIDYRMLPVIQLFLLWFIFYWFLLEKNSFRLKRYVWPFSEFCVKGLNSDHIILICNF